MCVCVQVEADGPADVLLLGASSDMVHVDSRDSAAAVAPVAASLGVYLLVSGCSARRQHVTNIWGVTHTHILYTTLTSLIIALYAYTHMQGEY